MHVGLRSLLLSGLLVVSPALAQEDPDLDESITNPESLSGEEWERLLKEQRRQEQQQGTPDQREQRQQVQQREQVQQPREQVQVQPGTPMTGVGEDHELDELLDGATADSQVVPDETQVRATTPQAGREIQAQIDEEIPARAEQIAREQEEWGQLTPDEQRRRLEEAKRSLREFAERVRTENAGMADALTRVANASEIDGSPVTARGYGVPVRPVRSYDPSGREELGGEGEGQARWWEKLLMKLIEGAAGAARAQVATVRMNELKARADRMALKASLQNRPFVDARIRQAVDSSSLARMGYDRRLDDVLLGGHRGGTGPLRAEPAPTPVTNVPRGSAPRVAPRLPRVPDPITRVERPTVNLPLGVDPVTVIRPR